jgi:curved DNA-binding protein CbpA
LSNTVQNFYQLLSVEPTATAEEIKRAFRNEIALYHPDKVQHLGKEFQEMAATRAANLTEAYRTLMNVELRAEYDRLYASSAPGAPASATPPPAGASQPAPPPVDATPEPPRAQPQDPQYAPPPRFASERRDRDDFVRKATIDRFRQALAAEVGAFNELALRGFDLDCAAKGKKLFSRNGSQRFAIKFAPRVDRQAVQDAWNAAQKSEMPICVFVMGNGVASARELGDTIADLRKRSRGTTQISIIPVDVRDWSAHMPADAPPACKNLLKRLRDASTL